MPAFTGHTTVRDSLKSYGSRCSAIRMQKAPMSEEMRSGSDDPRQPVSCAFGPLAQPLELIAGPADQEGIDTMQCRGQFRLVEVTVVVDPALDGRSEHPRQILCRITFSAFGLAAGRKEVPYRLPCQTACLGRKA